MLIEVIFYRIPFFLFICILCVCEFHLYICLYIMCVPGIQGHQKRVLNPLELELQTVENHHVVTGN